METPRNRTQYGQRVATDANGFIELGNLPRVERIWIESEAIQRREFIIDPTLLNWPTRISQVLGKPVVLALPEDLATSTRWKHRFKLVEYRSNLVYQDVSDKLKLSESQISIEGLPAGRFVLSDGLTGASVEILVTDARVEDNYFVTDSKILEKTEYHPLVIRTLEPKADVRRFEIDGADNRTRVHIVATSFSHHVAAPAKFFSSTKAPDLIPTTRIPSFYLDSMRLDEEYEYVLQRQLLKKYPGNMLTHPSVLLNPWELSLTLNSVHAAQAGDALAEMNAPAAAPAAPSPEGLASKLQAEAAAMLSPDYEFLANGAVVIANLVPDKDKQIQFDTNAFRNATDILIVAVHPFGTTYKRLSLPLKGERQTVNRHLQKSFDSDKHFAERERIRILKAKEKAELGDAGSNRVRIYGSISELFTLYTSLLQATPSPFAQSAKAMQDFQFITRWDEMSDKEKRQKYNDFACHELHFFLYHHDRKFFDTVILPYLANKFEPQFMDDWLLSRNLEKWIKPWQLEKLNSAERVLLAVRTPAHAKTTQRWISNIVDANPQHKNPALRSNRFAIAMLGDSLDASRALIRITDGIDEVERLSRSESKLELSDMTSNGAVHSDFLYGCRWFGRGSGV